MTMLYAQVAGARLRLDLASQPLGRGAEADVFRVRNLSGAVAKIYHRREGVLHANRAKLEAMIELPPQHLTAEVEGVSLLQFAWPTHIVEDEHGGCTGFLMPEVPLDRAITFEVFMSRDSLQQALSADDRSLPRRVTICRNLSAALAELHRQHHYFVDIKPQNIYLFKNTSVVCLVDTDSFAISGLDGSRFPASVYSAEYIAPELLRDDVPARMVQNDRQDCYALAVLIFRILDNGFHPFQGIPATNTDTSEWNIDHSVLKGYYPHGREPNPASTRPPSSTSDLWDTETRALFDRAFASCQPGVRPSAAEWRSHFDSLLQRRGAFVKCGQVSSDVLHIHFANADCPECRLEAIDSSFADSGPRTTAPPDPKVQSQSPPLSQPQTQPPLPGPSSSPKPKWLFAIAAAVLATVLFWPKAHKPSIDTPARAIAAPPTNSPAEAPQAAPTSQQSATTPELMQLPDDAAMARAMTNGSDEDALAARGRLFDQAVGEAYSAHQDDLATVLRAGRAGDDVATAEAAARAMRRIDWSQHFGGWTRFRAEARAFNKQALAMPESSFAEALEAELQAIGLDPFDLEIAGNLGTFLARHGKAEEANMIAVYALSLPRRGEGTGRSADWQLLASTYAQMGKTEESFAAYAVALAITPRLSGLCTAVLQQQATYGESLKAPIDALFQRIQERGQSDFEGCSYPPNWRN
jgi:serine/threonine protein kinase